MPNKELKEVFTRKEVERLLKISRSQIYNFIRSGKLMAYKIGGSLRFQKEDINSLLLPHHYKLKSITKTKKPADFTKAIKGEKAKKGIFKTSFEKTLRDFEGLKLYIDNRGEKYKIGDFLVLDFKDFKNENPHIVTAELKRHFKEALISQYSFKTEQIEEILSQIESKLKEFGRKIFIRNMQLQNNLYSKLGNSS